jgi:hypothetical protein
MIPRKTMKRIATQARDNQRSTDFSPHHFMHWTERRRMEERMGVERRSGMNSALQESTTANCAAETLLNDRANHENRSHQN